MIKDNLWQPRRCNCWLWARVMKFLCGGKIIKVKSELWPGGFHILWERPDGAIFSYSPINEDRIGSKQSIREWIFEGCVKPHRLPGD